MVMVQANSRSQWIAVDFWQTRKYLYTLSVLSCTIFLAHLYITTHILPIPHACRPNSDVFSTWPVHNVNFCCMYHAYTTLYTNLPAHYTLTSKSTHRPQLTHAQCWITQSQYHTHTHTHGAARSWCQNKILAWLRYKQQLYRTEGVKTIILLQYGKVWNNNYCTHFFQKWTALCSVHFYMLDSNKSCSTNVMYYSTIDKLVLSDHLYQMHSLLAEFL